MGLRIDSKLESLANNHGLRNSDRKRLMEMHMGNSARNFTKSAASAALAYIPALKDRVSTARKKRIKTLLENIFARIFQNCAL